MSVIIPGDSLEKTIQTENLAIGPGIYKYPKSQTLIPSNAGYLHSATKHGKQLVYIDSNSKRYIPLVNDYVIGIVTGSFTDAFKVSLQQHSPVVLLSMLAFPNATKKYRPNIKVGQAVYARVSSALADVDAEIECIDPETGKDGGFGVLDESGFVFDVKMNFARELLFNKTNAFLEILGQRVAFEIAVGINGKVWIKCGTGLQLEEKQEDVDMDKSDDQEGSTLRDFKATLAAARYLQACQNTTVDQAKTELALAFKGVN